MVVDSPLGGYWPKKTTFFLENYRAESAVCIYASVVMAGWGKEGGSECPASLRLQVLVWVNNLRLNV